jgi:hypothetical protein
MSSGIVIGGRAVRIPGLDVTNYLDDPRLRLAPGDRRMRSARERSWVHVIVVHTTGGIPGGNDLRPQVILPGLGPNSGGGQRVVASWTHDTQRPGGAHLVVDFDGSSYCCADLLDEAAYHAQRANGPSIGIEVVQGHGRAELYQEQLDVAARLALAVCRLMPDPIQWQMPASYAGHPVKRFTRSLEGGSEPLHDVVGIVGHRDLTTSRGSGDPGNAMMEALAAAGCEKFDFDAGADLAAWKERQIDLSVMGRDGVPGPQTTAALKLAGHPDGIWQLPIVGVSSP